MIVKLLFLLTGNNQLTGSESTCVYRNIEVRLKRLHNRILKDAFFEKNVASNGDKCNKSQISQDKTPVNTTTEKLIEQANEEVLDYEEMDWEPMNDEEITLEVLLILNYCVNNLFTS